MKKYYAFYTWPYGIEARCEEFDAADHVEAFYKKAMDNKSDYRGLVIIYGERVEFEPVKVVDVWRVK